MKTGTERYRPVVPAPLMVVFSVGMWPSTMCQEFPERNSRPQREDNSMLSANLDALRRPEQESVIKTRRTRWVGVSAFIVGLVCSVFALTLAPSAIAQTTRYIYTGAPFTGCAFGGCSPGATHITGSFTVAKPLPNDLVSVPCSDPSLPARCLVQIFPISFSFTALAA